MFLQGKKAKVVMLAGISFLALPLIAESGTSRDRSPRDDARSSFSDLRGSISNEEIVQGKIFKKEGDQTLRSFDGERITFLIDDQTNQLCQEDKKASETSQPSQGSSMTSMGRTSSGQQSSSAGGSSFGSQSSSMSPSEQSGQTTGTGLSDSQSGQSSQHVGFVFGDCKFERGEIVKAKIDQNGTATFVRTLGHSEGTEFSQGRMGDEYFVLPAGQLGGLDISDPSVHYSVQSSDGEKIGQVYKVMTSAQGDLAYAIIRKEDGQLVSVPWQALEGIGNHTFKVKVAKNQLDNLPVVKEEESPIQHVQRNWDLSEQKRTAMFDEGYGDDRFYRNQRGDRQSRYDSSRDYPELGSRPGEAGEPGEVSIFGSPSTLPPGQHAPQYKGADRQRFRGDDFRSRGDRQQRSDRNRPSWYSQGFETPLNEGRYMDPLTAPRYSDRDHDRYMFDQERHSRYSDDFRNQRDRGRSFDQDRYSRSRSGKGDYNDRPEVYRP